MSYLIYIYHVLQIVQIATRVGEINKWYKCCFCAIWCTCYRLVQIFFCANAVFITNDKLRRNAAYVSLVSFEVFCVPIGTRFFFVSEAGFCFLQKLQWSFSYLCALSNKSYLYITCIFIFSFFETIHEMAITKCPNQLKISHFLASWRSFLGVAVKCTVYEKKIISNRFEIGWWFFTFFGLETFFMYIMILIYLLVFKIYTYHVMQIVFYYIVIFAHYAINDTTGWVRKSTLLDIGNGVG